MIACQPSYMNSSQPDLHIISTDNESSLKGIISKLIKDSECVALKNKSVAINNIDSTILLKEKSEQIISIIQELLVTVVSNSLNSKIYITAEKYKDVIMLNIQDRNNNNGYAMAFSIMSVEQQANEAGGSLKIDGQQKKIATVSFCFPNLAAAC